MCGKWCMAKLVSPHRPGNNQDMNGLVLQFYPKVTRFRDVKKRHRLEPKILDLRFRQGSATGLEGEAGVSGDQLALSS